MKLMYEYKGYDVYTDAMGVVAYKHGDLSTPAVRAVDDSTLKGAIDTIIEYDANAEKGDM